MEPRGLVFFNATSITSLCLLIAAFLFGAVFFTKLKTEQRWYVYYLGFILLVELTIRTLSIFGIQNMAVYPFYICGEFLILCILFIHTFGLHRNFILLALALTAVLGAESLFLWLGEHKISTGKGKLFSHLIIGGLTAVCLIKKLSGLEPGKQNFFLIVYASLFLYYLVSVFFFIFMDQLTSIAPQNASILWGMNNLFSTILYGASFYTFLRLRKLA